MSTMRTMSMLKRVFLLIGSPKGVKSTSFSLGSYLLEGFKQKGWETRQATVENLVSSAQERENILYEINSSDVLIIVSPLYVDSLPAVVLRTLEMIKDHRVSYPVTNNPMLLAVINSGFPEAFQNNIALSILRRFAQESGFRWAGGLALGGGGAIDSRPLKSVGGMVKNAIKSLDSAASALAAGKEIPQEAIELIAMPMMPKWMFPLFPLLGGMMWRKQAKKFGTQKRLNDCPYEVSDDLGTIPLPKS